MFTTEVKGVVFDLDGVITDTAGVHADSWEKMFNDFLQDYAERNNVPFLPFDKYDDYQKYVDGKPRYAGVKSFLESRGIKLSYGTPEDSPDEETICGLGNRKNDIFQAILKEKGPEVFQTSVAFVESLRAEGLKVAVASSSKNARLVLELAGLDGLFDTVVGGIRSAELQLAGKPEPDIFVTAAKELGLWPGECMVVEDAISGVQAGRAGNFGLVLGVSRTTSPELLRRFGADKVVQDLSEIPLDEIHKWFLHGIEKDSWRLTYEGFDPGDEKLRETLTTVGNGFMATRGSFESESASFNFYPGTYIAGMFNKLPSEVHGRTIYNNDFVNCPNWTAVEIKIGTSDFKSPLSMELLNYTHALDMKKGVMMRTIICRDGLGRLIRLHTKRFVSMANRNLACQQFCITPLNFSDTVTIRSSLDGNVINAGVARYRALSSNHLDLMGLGATDDGVSLHVKTKASNYHLVMRAKTRAFENQKEIPLAKRVVIDGARISEEMDVSLRESATCTFEKLVAVHTTLEEETPIPEEAEQAAIKTLDGIRTFRQAKTPHARAWEKLWEKADIVVGGDRFVQKVTRLHIFHLLSTASPHNTDLDAGMPARGLHGEAYRGHIFWDELYILPFFDLNFPDIAKALLTYRVKRLDAAREYARSIGAEGAMYPWQTADDGGEETQEVHYNPESDSWGPDLSRRQRHVSIAIFYNFWRYYTISGDKTFLRDNGAEVMLAIARFWASIASLEEDGRYHIRGVMGPDEFHEKMPDSDEPGLSDNAYTNIMVVWLMEKALSLMDILPRQTRDRLLEEMNLTEEETAKWRDMTRRMKVIIDESGVISQFEGYMDLDELDWDHYRRHYYSIHRMDRILKAEGDSPDHYKVAKQADVLMTWYVLSPESVARILEQLGYPVEDPYELLRVNYDYYKPRTSHGSTLSKVVHAVVSNFINRTESAWDWFLEAMRSDLFDTQGGTTIEGIHTGVMAGTLMTIVRYFAGVEVHSKQPIINPSPPPHFNGLALRFCHRRVWYNLRIGRESMKMWLESDRRTQSVFQYKGEMISLPPGEVVELPLDGVDGKPE
ncbi:beta-phosphoglucomutase family hydrolase [Desulfohalovibrio reitneri]|uniref:beta-phosphoglucomutase family hydrolase n=1 Tax=Desulfohalovibrio reitneri TaxID=1307759 RepID=UPI00054FB6AC|nr:beta-phosphoglucomutase family hydrolase [Desulfohalovibrio reitneri]